MGFEDSRSDGEDRVRKPRTWLPVFVQGGEFRRYRGLVRNPRTATKSAAPKIAHRSGKDWPSNEMTRMLGRPRTLASQEPRRAPMNPRAIETRQPPRE